MFRWNARGRGRFPRGPMVERVDRRDRRLPAAETSTGLKSPGLPGGEGVFDAVDLPDGVWVRAWSGETVTGCEDRLLLFLSSEFFDKRRCT